MAAATAEAPVATSTPEIVSVLEDKTLPVKQLLAKLKNQLAISQAWAAGLIEFGRRTYVTMGKAGSVKDSTIIVEKSWAWTGPKTVMMKGFRDLLAEDDRLPKAKEYKEYPLPSEDAEDQKDNPDAPSPLVTITMEQTHTMIGLHVRLTDKGLTLLQGW